MVCYPARDGAFPRQKISGVQYSLIQRDPQRIKYFSLFLDLLFLFFFFFYLNQLSAERKRLSLNAVPTLGLVGIALTVSDLLRGLRLAEWSYMESRLIPWYKQIGADCYPLCCAEGGGR